MCGMIDAGLNLERMLESLRDQVCDESPHLGLGMYCRYHPTRGAGKDIVFFLQPFLLGDEIWET